MLHDIKIREFRKVASIYFRRAVRHTLCPQTFSVPSRSFRNSNRCEAESPENFSHSFSLSHTFTDTAATGLHVTLFMFSFVLLRCRLVIFPLFGYPSLEMVCNAWCTCVVHILRANVCTV